MKHIIKLIISLLIPLAVGGIAGFFTSTAVTGWYSNINKPFFNPPNWLFAPVWTILYIMMGIAFYLVWRSNAAKDIKRTAASFYFIQLVLNFCWSLIFFAGRQPGWAIVDILLLWAFIFLTIVWFRKISKPAAWLMVPYICWVSFATVLNVAIWEIN